MGRLEAIWIKRNKRGPMDALRRATLSEGKGLENNADHSGRRELTMISQESWRQATAQLGVEVTPQSRRANLLLSGIDLSESWGRRLRIGACQIVIRGETRPCQRMDEAHPGLCEALKPDWRAGAFGQVVLGGEIAVGDTVEWDEGSAT